MKTKLTLYAVEYVCVKLLQIGGLWTQGWWQRLSRFLTQEYTSLCIESILNAILGNQNEVKTNLDLNP